MMAAIRKDRIGRRMLLLAPLVAASMLMSAFAPAAATEGDPHRLTASLTGAKEVPGPGDPDGRGRAEVTLAHGKLCFDLSWRNIDTPTAAHIHFGTRAEAGPVVVLLFAAPSGLPPTITEVGGCVTVDHALLHAIHHAPGQQYYVNVHNVAYPAGAIRGQLRRAG